MAQHRTFLSKADRERILQRILRGELAESKAPPAPKTTIGHEVGEAINPQTTRVSSHVTGHTSSHMSGAAIGSETTIRELKRILVTATVLVLMLIGLALIQSKTPYINDLSIKLGSALSL